MHRIKPITAGSDKSNTKRSKAVTIELKVCVFKNPYSLKEKYLIRLTISKERIKVSVSSMCGSILLKKLGRDGVNRINNAREHPPVGQGSPTKNFLHRIDVEILKRANLSAVQAIKRNEIQIPSLPNCSKPNFHAKNAGVTPNATRSTRESSCTPNSLDVFVSLAIFPSNPSKTALPRIISAHI